MDFRIRCERVYTGNQSFFFLTFITRLPVPCGKPSMSFTPANKMQNRMKASTKITAARFASSLERKYFGIITILASVENGFVDGVIACGFVSVCVCVWTRLGCLLRLYLHTFSHSSSSVKGALIFFSSKHLYCKNDDVIGSTALRTTGCYACK